MHPHRTASSATATTSWSTVPRMTKEMPLAVRTAVLDSDNVLTTRQALTLGMTESQARRLAASSRSQGFPRGVLLVEPPVDLLRSRARAAQLLVPDGLLCGPTAARLLGMQGLRYFDEAEPIHLLLPNERTRWQRARPRAALDEEDDAADHEPSGSPRRVRRPDVATPAAPVDRATFVALADSAAHRSSSPRSGWEHG